MKTNYLSKVQVGQKLYYLLNDKHYTVTRKTEDSIFLVIDNTGVTEFDFNGVRRCGCIFPTLFADKPAFVDNIDYPELKDERIDQLCIFWDDMKCNAIISLLKSIDNKNEIHTYATYLGSYYKNCILFTSNKQYLELIKQELV